MDDSYKVFHFKRDELITLDELKVRWPDIPESELIASSCQTCDELTAWLEKFEGIGPIVNIGLIESPDGETIYECGNEVPIWPEEIGKNHCKMRFDLSRVDSDGLGIVFIKEGVEQAEARTPSLKWKRTRTLSGGQGMPTSKMEVKIVDASDDEQREESPEEMVKRLQYELQDMPEEEREKAIAKKVYASGGISIAQIGLLLPANPGTVVGYEGQKSRGQRLLDKK